jgi:hypothetical protein
VPIKRGMAFVIILPRFIAASIPVKFDKFPRLVSPSAIYIIAPPDQCNSIGRAMEMLIRGLGCQCNLCTPTCLWDIVPSDRHASRHTRRKKKGVLNFASDGEGDIRGAIAQFDEQRPWRRERSGAT